MGHKLNTIMANAVADVLLAEATNHADGPCVDCLLGQTANVITMILIQGIAEDQWEMALASIVNDVTASLARKKIRDQETVERVQ